MKNQEWFERFRVRLGFEEEYFQEPRKVVKEKGLMQSILIKMALQSLSQLERKIIIMIYFDGFTERQAAEKLGLPKTRLHRLKRKALKALSKSIYVKLNSYSVRQLQTET